MAFPSSLRHLVSRQYKHEHGHELCKVAEVQNNITTVSPCSYENFLFFDQLVISASNNCELQQEICNIVSKLRKSVHEIVIKVLIINGYTAETINLQELCDNLHNKFDTKIFNLRGHYFCNRHWEN